MHDVRTPKAVGHVNPPSLLRATLYNSAARAAAGAMDPQALVSTGAEPAEARLPTWWLSLQQSANAPASLSFQLVCSILLPAQVAQVVPAASKGTRLGTAAMIGAVAQLMQPVFGAMSDRCRPRSRLCGRRRLFVIMAQLATCATLAVMALAPLSGLPAAQQYWLLAGGYGGFQLANCMFCGPMGAILPELVPLAQQGTSGGWAALWNGIAGLGASVLGIIDGDGLVTMLQTYLALGVLNILGLGLGVLAFGDRPGCFRPEAPPPDDVADADADVDAAGGQQGGGGSGGGVCCSSANGGSGGGCCGSVVAFFRPFLYGPFAAMFVFLSTQAVGGTIMVYFTQYYLKDVVAHSAHGFSLPALGLTAPVAKSAEGATAIFSLAQAGAFVVTSLPAGYLADAVGPKRLIGASSVGAGVAFAWLGYVDDYQVVMALGVAIGLVSGLMSGPIAAVMSSALPSTDNAARDMNLLQLAFIWTQIAVPPVCGVVIDAFGPARQLSAYRLM
jgi:MFS family permease